MRIDVLTMAEGSTDFARNLAGENGGQYATVPWRTCSVRAPEEEEQHRQPDEQRDAEHRAHEQRELARVGLIGRRRLGQGGPVSTGMAGSWPHSTQPGS